LWQFPHFLAIAWMYREQYAKAGILMLPVVEPAGKSRRGKLLFSRFCFCPSVSRLFSRFCGFDLFNRRAVVDRISPAAEAETAVKETVVAEEMTEEMTVQTIVNTSTSKSFSPISQKF
jgi:heme O synthase-like polyprenyltransferase